MTPAKITQLRERIAATKTTLRRIESGAIPIPLEDAKAKLDAALHEVAASGQRNIELSAAEILTAGGSVLPLFGIAGHTQNEQLIQGLLAMFLPQMRAHMHKALEEQAELLPAGQTPQQQAAEIERLRGELLKLEAAEFKAVEEARAAGHDVQHRADLDPSVMLGFFTE